MPAKLANYYHLLLAKCQGMLIVKKYYGGKLSMAHEKPNHHQDTTSTGFHQSTIPQSGTTPTSSPGANDQQNNATGQTAQTGNATTGSVNIAATNHDKPIRMGKEAGLDYTVNNTLLASLKSGDKRTANYLIHRMLWDQQEKLDLDDIAISQDGTMEVQDEW